MKPRDTIRSYAPRGLRRDSAAAWIGVSATKFDEMVKSGVMPKPKRVDGIVVWDRYQLDEAFEALPDDGAADPWNEVSA
jgi:predicted DNA-binding transcriptional regulator AlpA